MERALGASSRSALETLLTCSGSVRAAVRHEVFDDAAGRVHVANLAALPLADAADFARALAAASARRTTDAGGPRGAQPPRHGAATFVVTLLAARHGGGALHARRWLQQHSRKASF